MAADTCYLCLYSSSNVSLGLSATLCHVEGGGGGRSPRGSSHARRPSRRPRKPHHELFITNTHLPHRKHSEAHGRVRGEQNRCKNICGCQKHSVTEEGNQMRSGNVHKSTESSKWRLFCGLEDAKRLNCVQEVLCRMLNKAIRGGGRRRGLV